MCNSLLSWERLLPLHLFQKHLQLHCQLFTMKYDVRDKHQCFILQLMLALLDISDVTSRVGNGMKKYPLFPFLPSTAV